MTDRGKGLPKRTDSSARRRVGRDDLCPCGSGKKYKKCCWGKNFIWVVDEQGNVCREVPIDDPELVSLIDEVRAEFRNQHGRELKDSNLLFDDAMDEYDIEKTMVDIMERAGVNPAHIYAFKKTGRLVTRWNKGKLTDAELREWQTAVEEYRALEKQSVCGVFLVRRGDLAMDSKQEVNQAIYQLKVTLKESKPPIWRRVQVPSNISLHRLHLILQAVMSQTNSHFYRFEIAGIQYGEPDPENDFYELHFEDSRRTRLSKVMFREKARFSYEYDFGDSWEHDILVERILPAEPGAQYPVCLTAKRACPPEDCGGVWGYAELLEIIRDPMHDEYERMMEWLGGSFDPEKFDLDEVNRSLRRFRQPSRPKRPDVPEVFHQAFESEDKRRQREGEANLHSK